MSQLTNKSWISLPDNVVQTVLGLVLSQSLHSVVVPLLLSLLQFPQKYFELPELPNHGFMKQESDVFLIVQSLNFADVAFLCPLPVSWLPGEHSFQDAQTSEILQILN